MNRKKEKSLTLKELVKRIDDYKVNKLNQSTESLGMFFDTEQNSYFYDTGTGKVLKVNDGLKRFLEKVLAGVSERELEAEAVENDLDIEEVLLYIQSEDLLKGTNGTKLYNDTMIKKAKDEIGNQCMQLILELTGACNLRCKYCIYSSSEIGYRTFHSENMPIEIIEQSIEYMKQHAEKDVFISFYGGEPLIRFDLMKYAIEYAKKELSDRILHFGFTTNLTLMNKEMAEYLVQIPNMSIVCSIDGPEDIHDKNRVYINGNGTYKDAIRGLNVLKEELDKVDNPTFSINFNAVYMVPYAKEKMHRIDENFKELCKITKESTYGISYPTSGTIPEELAEYDMDDDSMWQWMKEKAKNSNSIGELENKSILESLLTIHDRMLTEKAYTSIPMNGCCVPGARRLYISTNGDMYACERIDKSPKLGNICTGIDMAHVLEKYFYEYSEKSADHCFNCWAAKMCPFCYSDRMTEDGMAENAHENCEAFKNQIKEQFVLYHQILEENPEVLDVLNDMETA